MRFVMSSRTLLPLSSPRAAMASSVVFSGFVADEVSSIVVDSTSGICSDCFSAVSGNEDTCLCAFAF